MALRSLSEHDLLQLVDCRLPRVPLQAREPAPRLGTPNPEVLDVVRCLEALVRTADRRARLESV